MSRTDPVALLMVVVAAATTTLLTLTEQYAAGLAALAAYTVAWLLLRPAA